MERFVRLLVGGGVALVAGLWAVKLFAVGSVPWVLGVALAAVGGGGLLVGTKSEIRY